MPQRIQPKFFPHPFSAASDFPPTLRPTVAFDMLEMFDGEVKTLLTCMCSARDRPFELLTHYARDKYIQNDAQDDLPQLILYHLVHRDYMQCGNGEGVWNGRFQYAGLLRHPSIQLVQSWCVNALFTQSNAFLGDSPDLMAMERRVDSSFLFGPWGARVAPQDGAGQESLLAGQIANLTEQMWSMTASLDRAVDRIEEMSHRASDLAESENLMPVREVSPGSIDPARMSLEQIARTAHAINTRGEALPSSPFSTAWTAPPPVSLTTLYSMQDLPPTSRAFLIDCFLDVFNAQTAMLAVHFYVRRMAALWQRGRDVVESALFSKEMNFLQNTVSSFVDKTAHLFSVKFLAMEGISLTGTKNVETLRSMFPSPGNAGLLKPVVDVESYLSGTVDTLRDCCVGLDRLRVSLLYGRDHPSYVGDGFLQSFLYRSYTTRHAGGAIETIMSLGPMLSSMTLPEDQKRHVDFFNGLFGKTLSSATERSIVEPKQRENFREAALELVGGVRSSGVSRPMPTTGALESLFESTPDGETLLNLVERMWRHAACLMVETGEPEDSVSGGEPAGESLPPEE